MLMDLVGIDICCALEKSFKQRQVIISGFLGSYGDSQLVRSNLRINLLCFCTSEISINSVFFILIPKIVMDHTNHTLGTMQHSCSQVLQESNLWANLSTALTTTFSSLQMWSLAVGVGFCRLGGEQNLETKNREIHSHFSTHS